MQRLRKTLARRVRELCDERDLAFTHAADLAGIGRATMARLLAAERSTGIDVLEQLASVLEVEPAELLRPASRPVQKRNPGPRPRRRRASR